MKGKSYNRGVRTHKIMNEAKTKMEIISKLTGTE